MTRFNRVMALTAGTALLLDARDISGDWQGTIRAGAQDIRIILKIAKSDGGGWKAILLSIDQSLDLGAGAPVSSD